MNRVFEKFVRALFRRALSARASSTAGDEPAGLRLAGGVTSAMLREPATGSSHLDLRPDLVFEPSDRGAAAVGDAPNLVIDTKWKQLGSGARARDGVSRSDLLQMAAYARQLDAGHVVLLYPEPAADVGPKTYDLTRTGSECRRVHVRFLDLSGRFGRGCASLVEQCRGLVEAFGGG